MSIRTTLRTELRKISNWVYGTLLICWPYADAIMLAVNEHLPTLAQYLPANIHAGVGLLVVVCNITRSAYSSRKQP